jgi:hypothetical protein
LRGVRRRNAERYAGGVRNPRPKFLFECWVTFYKGQNEEREIRNKV